MSNRKLFKIAGLVGLITIGSKLFGLIRDLVIANVYGTNITADAYNFAYLLTGNALILLGGLGGPFHSATVSVLSRIKNNPKEVGSFLIKITSSTFLILLLITLFVIFFKFNLAQLIAPGQGLDESYKAKLWQEISLQLELMSPLIIISGLLGILCGFANIFGGYFWPSFGPAMPSITIILFTLIYNNPDFGVALALGTLTGCILEMLVQIPYVIRAKANKNIDFTLLKNQTVIKDFGLFIGPALLSTTIGQITVYIDGFFCSGLEEGSWTATILANRLIQLPLGVLSTAFLVPFFPRFSELASSNNFEKLKQTAMILMRTLWFLILPITFITLFFSKEVVEIIFQRGAFNERSTNLVSGIFSALLFSMITYVGRDTLTRVFYSLGDSKIPLLIAGISIGLKILFNFLLVNKYHAMGIAASTSIVTLINFLLLAILLNKRLGSFEWIKNLKSLFGVIVSTSIVLFLSLLTNNFLLSCLNNNYILKLASVSLSFIILFGIYFGLTLLFKVEEANKILLEVKTKIFKK